MKRNYKLLLLAGGIFLAAALWLNYYMDGSSFEVAKSLAITLILIFNVFAKQIKTS
jgi:hypothetical protein